MLMPIFSHISRCLSLSLSLRLDMIVASLQSQASLQWHEKSIPGERDIRSRGGAEE